MSKKLLGLSCLLLLLLISTVSGTNELELDEYDDTESSCEELTSKFHVLFENYVLDIIQNWNNSAEVIPRLKEDWKVLAHAIHSIAYACADQDWDIQAAFDPWRERTLERISKDLDANFPCQRAAIKPVINAVENGVRQIANFRDIHDDIDPIISVLERFKPSYVKFCIERAPHDIGDL
jgi:hypothetical protein